MLHCCCEARWVWFCVASVALAELSAAFDCCLSQGGDRFAECLNLGLDF